MGIFGWKISNELLLSIYSNALNILNNWDCSLLTWNYWVTIWYVPSPNHKRKLNIYIWILFFYIVLKWMYYLQISANSPVKPLKRSHKCNAVLCQGIYRGCGTGSDLRIRTRYLFPARSDQLYPEPQPCLDLSQKQINYIDFYIESWCWILLENLYGRLDPDLVFYWRPNQDMDPDQIWSQVDSTWNPLKIKFFFFKNLY